MKYLVKIYQCENPNTDVVDRLFHDDMILTVKELFQYIMEGLVESNAIYDMEITEITEDGYEFFNIYTIKISDNNIEDIKLKS